MRGWKKKIMSCSAERGKDTRRKDKEGSIPADTEVSITACYPTAMTS